MTTFAAPGPLTPIVSDGWGEDKSWTLKSYLARGGYEGLKKANTLDAADIVDAVKASGLRGRGGAGFPTGLKWRSEEHTSELQSTVRSRMPSSA